MALRHVLSGSRPDRAVSVVSVQSVHTLGSGCRAEAGPSGRGGIDGPGCDPNCPDLGSRRAMPGSFYRPCLRPRGVTGMRQAHKLLPMRRSLWTRVIALFVGIWFVAAAAGPDLTHACPMHGGHSSAASAAEHADHGAVAEHHLASSSESPSHHGTQCTCLGQCCSTGPVAVLSARTALGDTDTVATRDAGLPDYAYVPVAAQHVLPLAHAPPLSA